MNLATLNQNGPISICLSQKDINSELFDATCALHDLHRVQGIFQMMKSLCTGTKKVEVSQFHDLIDMLEDRLNPVENVFSHNVRFLERLQPPKSLKNNTKPDREAKLRLVPKESNKKAPPKNRK